MTKKHNDIIMQGEILSVCPATGKGMVVKIEPGAAISSRGIISLTAPSEMCL